MRVITVFIASPSDVEKERKEIRGVCKRLDNDPLIENLRVSFKIKAWEDLFPTADNPQEIINELVYKCDIFVCLLYKKFGSGTLEEFLIAFDLWKKVKKPSIMFYFKKPKLEMEDIKNPDLHQIFV